MLPLEQSVIDMGQFPTAQFWEFIAAKTAGKLKSMIAITIFSFIINNSVFELLAIETSQSG